MKGAEALARAIRQSADRCYAVPGYPVSEVAALAGALNTVNEKTALEYALGDSLSGRRAAVFVKHVGLNACADPLVHATAQGLRSGVVIVAADDVGAAASDVVQDSRYYGEVARVPVLEPDGETLGLAVEAAFEASETFSRVAIVRVTPDLLDANVPEPLSAPRRRREGCLADPGLTMAGRAQATDRRTAAMFAWSRSSPLNRFSGGKHRAVTVYPPPAAPDVLAALHETGRPFLREHRLLDPPEAAGEPERFSGRGYYRTFCRNCPFHPTLAILRERNLRAACDAGCAILAMNPPYRIGVATYGLGSSVAVAATGPGVALTGDYALLHSGLNALIDVYERKLPLLCIVFANNRMGMTGGHPVPDILRYIAWANPVVCAADDIGALRRALVVPDDGPRTVVIEGSCPEGETHETVEYRDL
ncbi:MULTISPECIES: thiamine pyrophosphate-dependent enzyme [Methanoculleus]|uniref:Indolepyruvate ferredoxin oxidoreductase alpha and beta subunits-like protein n=2 Tax=Methanoculleus TaxID=45989 RepID=A3CT65_METMJ|nr:MULTISPECIES: thiamine pyrophosphate-dependent enzyme [Methanoculleus]ABN56565.1 indolepyruvate ferredoxin oxidoreductase alpha and beta subunits-like protein [Methanoculleus marisnigri JR1]UYU18004.1 thiamine pyrophosphate-dependent enzyme [Methanoculleus submarinus]